MLGFSSSGPFIPLCSYGTSLEEGCGSQCVPSGTNDILWMIGGRFLPLGYVMSMRYDDGPEFCLGNEEVVEPREQWVGRS